MAVLYCFLIIAGIIVLSMALGSRSNNRNSGPRNTAPAQTIRCPNCGGQAKVHGSSWECGWCGDCGRITSHHK